MIKHVDKSQLALFESSLPDIRKRIGVKESSSMDNTFGVAGSTFRAYSGHGIQPSLVFRGWAKSETEKICETPPTNEISGGAKYCKWHSGLADSLGAHWEGLQGSELSFAHKYKLIDLYIKWLSQFKYIDAKFVSNLNRHAFCALDRQTLNKINVCYSMCMPINSPSMGHIYNEYTYEFCQSIIKKFCEVAGATSLEFDHWAWKKGG